MIHRFLIWATTLMEVSLVEMGNPWKKGTLRAGTVGVNSVIVMPRVTNKPTLNIC